jgi:DNA adenine methylase
MSSFISAKEVAKKWNISQRRVSILCSENRISGAIMVGNMWIIPSDAEKPIDKRTINHKNSIPIKPFVKWVGGKGQLVDILEKFIPLNGEKILTKYAEPFVGGGALLFNILSKYKFESIYISDINSELINAYNIIKNDVYALIDNLSNLQDSYLPLNNDERKDYYYNARKNFNDLKLSVRTAVQKAALFIFLNKTCFNGLYRVNRKGRFNVPMGAYKKPVICDKKNLIRVAEALQNVTVICGDYSLSKDFIDKNTLVYLDPPYRPISETASFTAYNADVFNDDEQIRLSHFVDEINAVGAKLILSNSDPKNVNINDNFFEHLYGKYKINKVEATRMINSNSEKRGKINELLICNFKGEMNDKRF